VVEETTVSSISRATPPLSQAALSLEKVLQEKPVSLQALKMLLTLQLD
jgi:hypothetical protein